MFQAMLLVGTRPDGHFEAAQQSARTCLGPGPDLDLNQQLPRYPAARLYPTDDHLAQRPHTRAVGDGRDGSDVTPPKPSVGAALVQALEASV